MYEFCLHSFEKCVFIMLLFHFMTEFSCQNLVMLWAVKAPVY